MKMLKKVSTFFEPVTAVFKFLVSSVIELLTSKEQKQRDTAIEIHDIFIDTLPATALAEWTIARDKGISYVFYARWYLRITFKMFSMLVERSRSLGLKYIDSFNRIPLDSEHYIRIERVKESNGNDMFVPLVTDDGESVGYRFTIYRGTEQLPRFPVLSIKTLRALHYMLGQVILTGYR